MKPKNDDKPKRKRRTRPYFNEKVGCEIMTALIIICILTLIGPMIGRIFYNIATYLTSEEFVLPLQSGATIESQEAYPACGILRLSEVDLLETGVFALRTGDGTNPDILNFDLLEINGYMFTEVVDVTAALPHDVKQGSYRFLYRLPDGEQQRLQIRVYQEFTSVSDAALKVVFEDIHDPDTRFRPELVACVKS